MEGVGSKNWGKWPTFRSNNSYSLRNTVKQFGSKSGPNILLGQIWVQIVCKAYGNQQAETGLQIRVHIN